MSEEAGDADAADGGQVQWWGNENVDEDDDVDDDGGDGEDLLEDADAVDGGQVGSKLSDWT